MANPSYPLRLVLTAVDRITAPLNRVTANIARVTKPMRAVSNSISSLANTAGVGKVQDALKGVAAAASGVFDGAEQSIGRVIKVIAAATGAAYLFKREFIDTASTFENLSMSLEAIEGSKAKAAQSMAFIKRLTIDTPMVLEEITKSFRLMKGQGMDPMGGQLEALTNYVSKLGGSGEMLTSIATQLSQAWSKTKLQQQDVRVMAEQGVGVWGLLSRAVERVSGGMKKITPAQLIKLSEQGKLGVKAINLLIQQMGIESAGANARMMKTFTGIVSNMSDQWTFFKLRVMDSGPFEAIKAHLQAILDRIGVMANNGQLQAWADKIGATFLRVFTWVETNGPKILTGLVSNLQSIGEKADWVAGMFGGWQNVIPIGLAAYIAGPLVASVFSLAAAVVTLGVAIGVTPVGWLLIALAALAAIAVTIKSKWTPIKAFFVDLWDGFRLALDGALTFLRGGFAEGAMNVFRGLGKVIAAAFAPISWLGHLTAAAGNVAGDFITGRAYRPPVVTGAMSGAGKAMIATGDFLTGRIGRPAGATALAPSGAPAAPISPQSSHAATTPAEARVSVDFKNVPKGTAIKPDPSNTAILDLSMGYSMAAGY